MFELFQYDFMRNALLAATAISIFSPLLGVFLVLRRQSLMSDTLSHVSLAGVAFGVLLSWNPTITTLITVVIAEQYLFGSIITISLSQVIMLFVLAAVVLLGFILFLRPLYVMTFDEDTAFVDGLPVRWISIAFNIVTGVAIALMIPAAGALLVSAIMVLPASIAMRLGKSFKAVLFISVIVSFIGLNAGLIASYYMDAPASAAITLIFIVLFLVTSSLKRLIRA